ncbi:Hypothetical predicted protein [Mytilus galloprovincialis]|uniref:Uncharacterized protein n=1 Tax=Mytilus galloprovincialis TaxID=29158 RepID=A0A8B6H3H9_MYTGA|nr:Hypothetical predicted protein [Mytilus galloprovincialis]
MPDGPGIALCSGTQGTALQIAISSTPVGGAVMDSSTDIDIESVIDSKTPERKVDKLGRVRPSSYSRIHCLNETVRKKPCNVVENSNEATAEEDTNAIPVNEHELIGNIPAAIWLDPSAGHRAPGETPLSSRPKSSTTTSILVLSFMPLAERAHHRYHVTTPIFQIDT